MIDIQLNMDAQTIDFVEGGAVIGNLSFPEATSRGFSCVVQYEYVYDENGASNGQRRVSPEPDVSKLSAKRSKMTVTLRDEAEREVDCIEVSLRTSGGKTRKLVDVMLPFDETDLV